MGSSLALPRRLADLDVGERILVGSIDRGSGGLHPWQKIPRYRVCEIVERDLPKGGVRIRERDGTLIDVDKETRNDFLGLSPAKLLDGSDDKVLWTADLPNGSDEQILAYCEVIGRNLADANWSNDSILLYVEAIEDDVPIARPVFPSSYLEEPDRKFDDPPVGLPTEIVGNAAFSSVRLRLPELPGIDGNSAQAPGGERRVAPIADASGRPSVGDLVAAQGFSCSVDADGGVSTGLRGHAVVIGNFPTRADVGRFLPYGVSPRGWDQAHQDPASFSIRWTTCLRIADQDSIDRELSRAHARTEPNEALFLWHRPVGKRSTSCVILGYRGIVFHEIDDAADYFHGQDVDEGLWILEDATAWSSRSYEGEYDAGIEGSFRPATLEDVHSFGFTSEQIDVEIADFIEADEGVVGLAHRYIAMAAATTDHAPEMSMR